MMIVDKFGKEINTKQNYAHTTLGDYDNEWSYTKQAKVIQFQSKSDKNQKWKDWGENNLYPQEILWYATKSPITKGLIKKENIRINGDGVFYEEGDKPIDKNHPLFYTSPGVTLKSFINKLSQDVSYLSTFAFAVEYSLNKKKITSLNYVPSKTIRSGLQNSIGQVNRYYVSNDWAYSTGYTPKNPKSVAAYNPNKQLDLMRNAPQLYYFKNQNPNDYYYSDVSWDSALMYSKLDYEIQNFFYNSILNGLNPGLIISFPRTASLTEARKIKNSFKKEYMGSDNAGKMAFFTAANKESLPVITQLEANNLDKQYQALNTVLNEKVTLAFGIPRLLSGLETSTGLSNGGDALLQAEQEWFKSDISTKRAWIVDAINEICDYSGYPRITIKSTPPNLLQFGLTDTILTNNFTQNEIRQAVNYQTIDGGDKIKEKQ